MKRRLLLCALAILLFLGALASPPVLKAYPEICNPLECDEYCRRLGYHGGFCSGQRCLCWN